MKQKTTAGIFGILLGGIGIHKFYLGKIGAGVVYILFCWTFIPALIGLIEGIQYLTMSDGEFNQKYNGISTHIVANKENVDKNRSEQERLKELEAKREALRVKMQGMVDAEKEKLKGEFQNNIITKEIYNMEYAKLMKKEKEIYEED